MLAPERDQDEKRPSARQSTWMYWLIIERPPQRAMSACRAKREHFVTAVVHSPGQQSGSVLVNTIC